MVVKSGQKSEGRKEKAGLWERFSLWAAPLFFRLFSFLLFSTCRVELFGYEHYKSFAESRTPFIVSFWHYSFIYFTHQAESLPYVIMVSPSKDGEYIARILQSKGYITVRGSRGTGGIGAMKGLIRNIRQGRVGVLIADGSQGPARIVQAGAILLASRTGVPIIPKTWAASNYWTFQSWDKTAVPKPFSRIKIMYGEPLHVPRDADAEKIEEYRLKLEERLNELYEKGWEKFGKKEH